MAATTLLIVYNEALRELAANPLANTSTANVSLQTLDGAFDHAVEYVLAQRDWNFARRRATLTGTSDTSFQPFTYRYTRPSDYLRKCWVKTAASDDYQIDHAEVGAVIYGFLDTALIEYMSDHADNYDPANWPPHFTRVLSLYLAILVGPKVARTGAEEAAQLRGKMQAALSEAEVFEDVFLTNELIPAARQPVLRRALEFLGQELAGAVSIYSHADKLRWQMNRAWDHCCRYVLEQAAWNFATRRVTLTGGTEAVPGDVVSDVVDAYTLGPATEPADSDLPDMAGFEYGFQLPSDFLHKIWVRADANRDFECEYQFMSDGIYTNVVPVVLEYIGWDADSQDPTNWPATFLDTVAAQLALTVAPVLALEMGSKGRAKVTALDLRKGLEVNYMRKLPDAKTKDAIQQEPKTLPLGRFARSRYGSIGTTSIRRYN